MTILEKRKLLYDTALEHEGFFTAQQALEIGYVRSNFTYHVKAGNWERWDKGIYRLSHFPIARHANLICLQMSTWNVFKHPLALFSYETALNIQDITPIIPLKTHLAVSKTFRKTIKSKNVVLHRDKDLNYSVTHSKVAVLVEGVYITLPLYSLAKMYECGNYCEDVIAESYDEACRRGLITQSHFKRVRMNETTLDFFERLNFEGSV